MIFLFLSASIYAVRFHRFAAGARYRNIVIEMELR
jgi:hypothetical protein